MKKYLFLLTFSALLFLNFAKPVEVKPLKPKNYALFFAVEQYDDRKLKALKYPIQNAQDIRVELESNYGFQCETVVNPTYRDIKNKLNQYAQNFENGTFDKDGQLFIFFTGHGERESGNGFFLTKDTRTDELETTAFSYSYWRNKMDEMACKHIFVAIDACKSGSFDPATENLKGSKDDFFGNRGNEPSVRDLLQQEAAKYKTRLFATSGAMDISTPDKSAFAFQFLNALRSRGNVGNNNDNILTIKELAMFFESAYPQPTGGKFGSNEANANFLFVDVNSPITEAGINSNTVQTQTQVSPKSAALPISKKNKSSEYFNGDMQIDMAILINSTANKANLNNLMKTHFQSKNLNVSHAFFKPPFLSKYSSRLNLDDVSVFDEIEAKDNVHCVCVITPSVQYKQNEYNSSIFQTAIGNYDVKVFNLSNGDVSSFLINENGAGITETKALESLEDKFITIFQQKYLKPELCKN